MRRNNLRIYQVPEESEKGDIAGFVNFVNLLKPEINVHIKRAHRSLGLKPDNTAPPHSIIVRFLDYTVVLAGVYRCRGGGVSLLACGMARVAGRYFVPRCP